VGGFDSLPDDLGAGWEVVPVPAKIIHFPNQLVIDPHLKVFGIFHMALLLCIVVMTNTVFHACTCHVNLICLPSGETDLRCAVEKDKNFQMRVSQGFLDLIDDYRREQADLPSRAESIRRLVVTGNAFRTYDILALVAHACAADNGTLDKDLTAEAMAAIERITKRLEKTSAMDRTIGIEDILNTVAKEKGDR